MIKIEDKLKFIPYLFWQIAIDLTIVKLVKANKLFNCVNSVKMVKFVMLVKLVQLVEYRGICLNEYRLVNKTNNIGKKLHNWCPW